MRIAYDVFGITGNDPIRPVLHNTYYKILQPEVVYA